MATFLDPKASGEVVRREWVVPIDDDDGITSIATSGSGVTVDSSSIEGDVLVLILSAGTAASTGSITATVTTDKSRTLVETLYIPIVDSPAQIADTARNYCNFALRKIIGIGNSPEASELDDAIERLNALVTEWRAGGAEIAAPTPLTANSVIYCPDWAVNAIRYNLRLSLYGDYDVEPTAMDVERARRGLQIIKHRNLPDERKVEFF